jgi:hypothetical protein
MLKAYLQTKPSGGRPRGVFHAEFRWNDVLTVQAQFGAVVDDVSNNPAVNHLPAGKVRRHAAINPSGHVASQ